MLVISFLYILCVIECPLIFLPFIGFVVSVVWPYIHTGVIFAYDILFILSILGDRKNGNRRLTNSSDPT